MFVAMMQSYVGPVSETAFQTCFMSLVKWFWVI